MRNPILQNTIPISFFFHFLPVQKIVQSRHFVYLLKCRLSFLKSSIRQE